MDERNNQLNALQPPPDTWERDGTWPCICGDAWSRCSNIGTQYGWRGPVSYITPWNQFQRVFLDPRNVVADIDTLVRAYEGNESYMVTMERCDMRRNRRHLDRRDYAKLETRRAMDRMDVWGNWIMIQDGNVPLRLDHYPATHPHTNAPYRQIPSTWVDVLIYEDEWLSFDGPAAIRDKLVNELLSREFVLEMGRHWRNALTGA